MMHSNLKNFHCSILKYSDLFTILQSDFRRFTGTLQTIDLRTYYFISFLFTAIFRRFAQLIALNTCLSKGGKLFFYHKSNAYISLLVITFLTVKSVSGTRKGFLILLSKDNKVPIYYSPVA